MTEMSLWEAIVLGVVQGATEFLPVSSSGHLVLTQELMGLRIPGVGFEVAVHLATLISIMIVYRQRIIDLITGVIGRENAALKDLGLLVVATLPAAVLGILFKDRLEALFDAPWVPAIAFIVTGTLLWTTRGALLRKPDGKVDTVRLALLIGFAQAFALLPGISRSGSTVVMALWLGIAGREAAAFSFLMAIPAIGGAAILSIPDLTGGSGVPGSLLLAGGIAAALTGILAIQSFIALLRQQRFYYFSYYLWGLGVAFLVYLRMQG